MTQSAHRWLLTAAGRPLQQAAFEPAAPAAGEVVIEIHGCGVCHTDLGYAYDGVRTNHPLPLTLGHEISGRVSACGTRAASWEGKAVIVPAVIPCGECDLCRRGRGTICRRQKMPGNDIHGGFATHVTVPARGLCEVDEQRLARAGLDLADVCVVADAVTTPYQAVLQAEVQAGDLVVVVGVGGIGGYTVQVASAFGATVVAVDIEQARLDALAPHGASASLNATGLAPRALKGAVEEFARARGLPATQWKIFECSGSAAGQATAFGLLTFGATLAVVGFTMEKVELRLSNLMAFHARALGNWGCLPEHYPAALELALAGRITMKPFVEHHPLHRINEIFAAVHAHELARRPIMIPNA